MPAARVLVVDDDADMRALLEDELREAGYEVVAAPSGSEALDLLGSMGADAVVTDLVMPGMKGDELAARIRDGGMDVPVIIMTAFGSIDSAVHAMKRGAFDYITKPFLVDQLVATLEYAVGQRRWRNDFEQLRERAASAETHPLIAENARMLQAIALVHRAAAADSPVLLRGESGTGKELLALALHAESERRERMFAAVNCSAIPETLLEAQLFGHRRGAFTDAREDRPGILANAEGGTVFLDEIGDMPLGLQSKLLRVIQQKEIQPLGSPGPVKVDVRIVAATHRDLEKMVREGLFRQDLYYRLNVITIQVPPLRERPEDLAPLVAHFIDKHGRRLGRPSATVSLEVMDRLRGYGWPGNVRELENVIERALVLGRGEEIRLSDLPEAVLGPIRADEASGVRLLADTERDQIIKALSVTRGNKSAAARLLGLDRKTLYRKLDAYRIKDA